VSAGDTEGALVRGVAFPRAPQERLGDSWPEEESVDEFVAPLREWRPHPD
jgi:hypothetical protein